MKKRGTKRKTTQKVTEPSNEPDEAVTDPQPDPEPATTNNPEPEPEPEVTTNPTEPEPEPEATANPAEPEPEAEASQKPDEEATKPKRRKVSKAAESETEYFSEKRNLEDLWRQTFPVGTEWDQLDMVYQYNWNFSNLEDAFEEGGELHDKSVYLFGCTEPQLLFFNGQAKVTMIPVVVAVVSPFPPSDKIGIKSVQRETEEIIPMKQMKMDWVPYIPLEKREAVVERMKKKSKIFILSCTQRRAGLKQMKIERVKKFEYCLPYFYQPLQEDELEQSTVVPILYPIDPKPVFCEFDWEFDELQEFVDKLVEAEEVPEDQKDAFKDFVKEKVREARKANREAREARKKAVNDMSQETKAAFENMRFVKFYPVSSPDTPDVSSVKSPFINRYYGKAHLVI